MYHFQIQTKYFTQEETDRIFKETGYYLADIPYCYPSDLGICPICMAKGSVQSFISLEWGICIMCDGVGIPKEK